MQKEPNRVNLLESKGTPAESKGFVSTNSFGIMQRFQNFPNGKLLETM